MVWRVKKAFLAGSRVLKSFCPGINDQYDIGEYIDIEDRFNEVELLNFDAIEWIVRPPNGSPIRKMPSNQLAPFGITLR